MTRTMTQVAVAVLAWATVSVASQAQPDFSGRWTVDPDPQAPPPVAGSPPAALRGDMGSGWGPAITITQDTRQLVVEYVFFRPYDLQPPLRFVYALDGSETRNSLMVGHTSQLQRSRASWDGQALGITTLFTSTDPASGKPYSTEVKHRLTLESATSLVVEVTRGAAFGGRPSTTRKVYRKG